MNDYDGARMLELLHKDGYERADAPDEADLIVLNSCSVRERAESKVASEAGRFRKLKLARPEVVVAVAGCVAQQEGDKLLKTIPTADFTFGPDQIPNLPAMVSRFRGSRKRFAATDVIEVEDYQFLDADPQPNLGESRVTALVTIQKGCDNHCAFCIVPATRGREVSRPADEVIAEVRRFVAAGAREVTLIGQNVNSYHGIGMPDGDDFAELLSRVNQVEGLLRIRFTTSHPHDFTPKVARAYRDLQKLCAFLHLPVQSGSSRTLRRMVRDYTRDEYLAMIDYVREVCPDISLSTDIIVGYPGESDAEFEETLTLLRRVEYDNIYSFVYSPRPETPALKLKLKDDVPDQVKSERLQVLQTLQRAITERRLDRWVGRTAEVLVEGEARFGDRLCGRTTGNEMVNFTAPGHRPADLIGRLIPVRILERRAYTLKGECALEATHARALNLPVVA